MKAILVVVWALAVSASTRILRDKRNIGISSGYGGAYSHASVQSIARVNKVLQSDAVASSSNNERSTPTFINMTGDLSSNIGISSGYGGNYGYLLTPNIVTNMKMQLVAISKKVDEDYSSPPSVNIVNSKGDLNSTVAISNGYGGAFDYTPIQNVASVIRTLQSRVTKANSDDDASDYALTPKVINFNKDLFPSYAISSGYGGAYGYFPVKSTTTVTNGVQSRSMIRTGYDGTYDYISTPRDINFNMPSAVAISSGYGAAYAYSAVPVSTVSNVVSVKKVSEIPIAMNLNKVTSLPQPMLSQSPSFSGYGNGIGSYSGYSRYSNYDGYGFAYANGWL